eukprot:COSAG03_NODE_5880_length_1156_cov_3.839841_1_plen_57_part_10
MRRTALSSTLASTLGDRHRARHSDRHQAGSQHRRAPQYIGVYTVLEAKVFFFKKKDT